MPYIDQFFQVLIELLLLLQGELKEVGVELLLLVALELVVVVVVGEVLLN